MNGKHPSHKTRFSWDASTFDEICTICGATDEVPGGWGQLAEPCTGQQQSIDAEEDNSLESAKL